MWDGLEVTWSNFGMMVSFLIFWGGGFQGVYIKNHQIIICSVCFTVNFTSIKILILNFYGVFKMV